MILRRVAWLEVIYRVIHKSLRDFRTRLRKNQDRHGRKEHINRERERDIPSFCPTLQVLDMCTLGDAADVTIDSVLANSKTQNAFLFTMNAIFHHYTLAVEPASTPRPLVQKKTWRDSLPIDMILSAVSVLVVAQSSSEIPGGLMNNPVLTYSMVQSPS